MSQLSIIEATALAKQAESVCKILKENGETIPPGNYNFDVTIRIDGALSRGNDTKVSPTFSLEKFLKPLLLRYAATLGKEEGKRWIAQVMDTDGALGAVIQLGADAVLQSVDPTLTAIWDSAQNSAKAKFQNVTPKVDRAGNTVVVGNLEVTQNNV